MLFHPAITGRLWLQPIHHCLAAHWPSRLHREGLRQRLSVGADVDIYFDTTDLAHAVADGSGSFSRIVLQVPGSALSGKHSVSAVDRSTGASAQTPLLVAAEWTQFRKQANHCGYNPNETVLSPTTVGGLGLLWKYTTGTGVFSSSAVLNGVVYVGSDNNNVYALNAHTGALLWKYTTGSEAISFPAVVNGVSTSVRSTATFMPSA